MYQGLLLLLLIPNQTNSDPRQKEKLCLLPFAHDGGGNPEDMTAT